MVIGIYCMEHLDSFFECNNSLILEHEKEKIRSNLNFQRQVISSSSSFWLQEKKQKSSKDKSNKINCLGNCQKKVPVPFSGLLIKSCMIPFPSVLITKKRVITFSIYHQKISLVFPKTKTKEYIFRYFTNSLICK